MSDSEKKTATFWDDYFKETTAGTRARKNFWDLRVAAALQRTYAFPEGMSYQLPGMELLAQMTGGTRIKTAISIGCGSAHKEIEFLKAGLVEHFTLVELAPSLIDAAKASAKASGLEERTTFIVGDYRDAIRGRTFDLVYFDNALHHMFGVDEVIQQCVSIINEGGFFLMDDFVGPTYNQFSDETLAYTNHIRGLLPPSFFESGAGDKVIGRLPVQAYLDTDPSEACDSSSILPSIAAHMPGARIIPTGGLVYYLALRELFQHLEADDQLSKSLLNVLFELDRALLPVNPDLTCYALAIWQKRPNADKAAGDWKALIQWPAWGIPRS